MARKSRRPTAVTLDEKKMESSYKTALYARLSIEDNGIEGESIENQIYIMEQFIKKNPELQLVEQFVDNGQTGTNFERPGFQAMMEVVRSGKVNCIVVKDLSRFGRNYLETGNYLEKIFPYLGIRFISIADHFDSMHAEKNDTLLIPLKSILHDTYAKDISKKVSTSIDIKKKSGKFMGKIPPYGYVRDDNDRHKLVVHPERAKIVKQIFQWRIEGMGPITIAHRLNDMEVPTQFQYRYMEGHADGKKDALWYGSTVIDMLKNPCYLGCLVERKERNLLYQGKNKTKIPPSEWDLIEGTHEPIVDKEIFYKVQELIAESVQKRKQQLEKNTYKQRTENILSGLVRCGICGGGMRRSSGYFKKDGTLIQYDYSCTNKYLKTGRCISKAIFEVDLLDCVYQVCKKQLDLLVDMEELIKDLSESMRNVPYTEQLENIERDLENERKNLRRKRNELYADYKEGLLTAKEYEFTRDKYMVDCEKIEKKMEAVQQEQKEAPIVNSNWLNRLIQFKNATSLTREMCEAMVDKVVVYEESVKIHFKFASEYEKALTFLAHYSKNGGKE